MIEPFRIDPDALYDDGALYQSLGLTPNQLAAARRDGTLRYSKRGRRTFYRGAWLLAWLAPDAPHAPATPSGKAVGR